MTVSVHAARYEVENQELIDTLQMNLPHLPHAQLFPWQYIRNPEGRAQVWVATDSETNRMIGVAAAFPRRVYCSGKEVRSYVLGDFCINATHRSLGLALALQRACLDGLAGSAPGFVFDFPSQAMLAVYKRMQIHANASIIRHAKLLRADRKIAEHMPVRAVARGLSLVANIGLRLRDNGPESAGGYIISADPGPWGHDFTEATREWSPRSCICVARTADYLNWRYREHPTQSYEMLTVRKRGRLAGYLVQHMNGEDCTIDDLMAKDDDARRTLLAEATAIARKRRVHTLSAPWLSTHPGCQVLEQCGFQPRESSPVVLLTLPPSSDGSGTSINEWLLTSGDWES
jgi:hypothetical protein